MGMFDYMICEMPLPDGSSTKGREFQTKSFDNVMTKYVITTKGHLYEHKWDYEWIENPDTPFGKQLVKVDGTYRRDYLTDLHGDIIFYSGELIDGKRYDYFARFSYGTLDRIWMKEWDRW